MPETIVPRAVISFIIANDAAIALVDKIAAKDPVLLDHLEKAGLAAETASVMPYVPAEVATCDCCAKPAETAVVA